MMNAFCVVLIIVLCEVQLGKLYTIRYDNGGVYDFVQDNKGNYRFRLKLQDQNRQESGLVTKSEKGEENIFVRGEYFYSYQGTNVRVVYQVGEDGIRSHARIYMGPPQPNLGTSDGGLPDDPLTGEQTGQTQIHESKVPIDEDGASRGYLPPLSGSFAKPRNSINPFDLRPPSIRAAIGFGK